MIRSWGVLTLTGSAQPCFGDTTTAAVPLPDSFGKIAVTVASTSRYQGGDRIIVAPETNTQDILKIDSIASSTVLNCQSEGNAKTHTHPTSTQILLSIACAEIMVQNFSSASNVVWLGTDNTVTSSGGGSAFGQALPGDIPYRFSNSVQFNAIRTSEPWMSGTNGQTCGIAAIVV